MFGCQAFADSHTDAKSSHQSQSGAAARGRIRRLRFQASGSSLDYSGSGIRQDKYPGSSCGSPRPQRRRPTADHVAHLLSTSRGGDDPAGRAHYRQHGRHKKSDDRGAHLVWHVSRHWRASIARIRPTDWSRGVVHDSRSREFGRSPQPRSTRTRFLQDSKRFPGKATCLAIYSRAVNAGESLEQVLGSRFPWCVAWEGELRQLFAAYVEAKQRQLCSIMTISCSTGRR
jgi:hypothetical protein